MRAFHCTHCRAKFHTAEAAEDHILMNAATEHPCYSYQDKSHAA